MPIEVRVGLNLQLRKYKAAQILSLFSLNLDFHHHFFWFYFQTLFALNTLTSRYSKTFWRFFFFWTFEMNVNSSVFSWWYSGVRVASLLTHMFGLEGHNQNISVVDVRQSASVDENHPSKKHLWEYNKTTVNKSEFSLGLHKTAHFFCKYLTALLFTSSRLFSAFQDDVQMSGFDLNGLFECLCPQAKGRSRSLALCIWKKLPLRSLCGTSCRLRA